VGQHRLLPENGLSVGLPLIHPEFCNWLYVLVGKQVQLVIDPHAGEALRVEDEEGEVLSMVVHLDVKANCQRQRRKPEAVETDEDKPIMETNRVEMALAQYNLPIKAVE